MIWIWEHAMKIIWHSNHWLYAKSLAKSSFIPKKECPDHFKYKNEDLIALSLWTVDGKSDDYSFWWNVWLMDMQFIWCSAETRRSQQVRYLSQPPYFLWWFQHQRLISIICINLFPNHRGSINLACIKESRNHLWHFPSCLNL